MLQPDFILWIDKLSYLRKKDICFELLYTNLYSLRECGTSILVASNTL